MNRLISCLLFACWAWALALAATPELHEWAHGGPAHHEEHECAATLIAAGACDAPIVTPFAIPVPIEFQIETLPLRARIVASVFRGTRPPERGPPSA